MAAHKNDVEMDEEVTVPQTSPMSNDQVMNNAGGFVWKIDDLVRLKRFLCLGSEGGTYYTSQQKLTQDNTAAITRLIKAGQGVQVVETIKEFSLEGRTAKQTSILLALAICARIDDIQTKRKAYEALGQICRIPTFLFEFIENCEKAQQTTGWGRAHRKAISKWYNDFQKNPLKLAMHVTKYRSRNDWCHRDVLRLAHTKPVDDTVGAVLRYAVKGMEDARTMYEKDDLPVDSPVRKVFEFLSAVEEAKGCVEEWRIIQLIQTYRLVREHIPTHLLSSKAVWTELLQNMPLTAMMRNLAKMTNIGVIAPKSAGEDLVVKKLLDTAALKEARIHPFNVLVALKTYQQGRGMKGKLTWEPTQRVVTALDQAFYKSFKFVAPTNKRYLLAVDVSGSMCQPVHGSSTIFCRDAAAAMMMVTKRTEVNSKIVAFSHKLMALNIEADMSMEKVLKTIDNLPFGGTDCALPMIYARKQRLKFDVFVVYTDNETFYGGVHPAEALRQYRKWSGIWDARLIVCGMSSNQFSIANPDDPGMMDVVGFDSAAPEAMRAFVTGQI